MILKNRPKRTSSQQRARIPHQMGTAQNGHTFSVRHQKGQADNLKVDITRDPIMNSLDIATTSGHGGIIE